ncbi:MAG: hypothetical protein IJ157_08145 [Clostridia bacterium]|nr:hypothetical protein [Clostridia bacterium]
MSDQAFFVVSVILFFFLNIMYVTILEKVSNANGVDWKAFYQPSEGAHLDHDRNEYGFVMTLGIPNNIDRCPEASTIWPISAELPDTLSFCMAGQEITLR